MTLTASAPDPVVGPPASAGGPIDRARLVNQVAGSMTTLIAIMLLVFVAEMALVGPVRHARAQNVLYSDFRGQLARGEAPTGQLDFNGDQVGLGAPIALLTIPSLKVREVVAEGTTAGVLMSGPGHRRDTPLPGQSGTSVILGRQATYGGPFRRLHEIEIGAEIAVTTGQGSQLFKVTGIRRPGDDLIITDPKAGRLTLITGDGAPYLASDVLRVDAQLVGEAQPAPSRQITAVPETEQSMAGDTSALLPLLLWSQLLLLLAGALTWVRSIWGRWQSWIVCVPVLGFVGFQVAHLVAQLLPNLL